MGWFIAILFVHFVADFILQTRWQATNKSKRWDALTCHCISYGLCLWVLPLIGVTTFGPWVWVWPNINMLLHFVTDAITSRQTARKWNDGKPTKAFWVWIGFDQWIHSATLIGTWYWLTN